MSTSAMAKRRGKPEETAPPGAPAEPPRRPNAPSQELVNEARAAFEAAWPSALSVFSPYTRLPEPILCANYAEEVAEGLEGSFAMIRMRDERIVIGLEQIAALGLAPHAHAILAHEVGHYVHAPGTLREHVRLHDRMRRTLSDGLGRYTGLVSNLYTDLLLNDRLQRDRLAEIAAVYRALRPAEASDLWAVYLRAYERLWLLPPCSLGPEPSLDGQADADLIARVVRHFRDDWLTGAASFALVVEPYLGRLRSDEPATAPWLDTAATSVGEGAIPEGLIEDDFDPLDVPHPAMDERLHEVAGTLDDEEGDERAEGRAPDASSRSAASRSARGDGRVDRRKVVRSPAQWIELLAAVGVRRDGKELVARYYRELALPHVIPFPTERVERAGDPLPEGLDPWEPGGPLESIDWLESLLRSPLVVPGVTTVERSYGIAEGGEPERRPPDLYLGIDCSGSMGNPAYQLAYPVLAGVVLLLSALRAGASVMVCLSGEWQGSGKFTQTDGFIRDEAALLAKITDYLGTGASFGLPRLATTFGPQFRRDRPVHVVVISDSDLFGEIGGTRDGWAIAKRAVAQARGGASAVLRIAPVPYYDDSLASLRGAGIEPHLVASEEELVTFARAFARKTYQRS